MEDQNPLADVPLPQDTQAENAFADVPSPLEAPKTPALPNKALIMAIARMDNTKSPVMQMTDDSIDQARQIIDSGQELTERYKISADRSLAQASAVNRMRMDSSFQLLPQDDQKKMNDYYNVILTADHTAKARSAMEEQAIENIQTMANRDPTQAKVLLDNLEHGTAFDVHQKNLLIHSLLLQRAEELDDQYQKQGWGKTILNFMLNLVPTNYNFSKAGVVKGAEGGFMNWLLSGNGLQNQGQSMYANLQGMSHDEIGQYLASDGGLMKSLADNSSTLGSFDPSMASGTLGELTAMSGDSKMWANIWGAAEVASIIPYGKVTSLGRSLVRAGARKEATNLFAKAADDLLKEGELRMTEKNGIKATDLRDEQSIKAVEPNAHGPETVPLSMDLATREEAARAAIQELPTVARASRLTNPDEVVAAYEKIEDRVAAESGRDIKDINFTRTTERLANDVEVRSVEYVYGKKAGGGYASKKVAERAASSRGLAGEGFIADDGQWYVRGKANITEQGFFTNPLHEPTQGFLSRMTGAWWRSSSRTTDPVLHGKAVAAGSSVGKMQRQIGKLINETWRGNSVQSQEALSQIMLQGANRKRWWTEGEVNDLMRRAYGREATEQELKTYHKMQLFNDMDWVLRNDHEFVSRAISGMENAKFTAKGIEHDGNALISRNPSVKPDERILNISDNIHYTSKNPLTDAEFRRLSDEGYVLVKTEDPMKLPDGTTVRQFMAKRADVEVGPLERTQLAYSEGGHRLYTDKYFVKQARMGRQADTGTEYLESPGTFVTAKNIAEARTWAETMNRAVAAHLEGKTAQEIDETIFLGDKAYPDGETLIAKINKGEISSKHPFEALYDNEMPAAYKSAGIDATDFTNGDERGFNGYYRTTGKKFTGHKGEILKDTKGEIASTVDAYEALSTSLQQVSRVSGLFNYKTEALERFLATYKNDLEMVGNKASNYTNFAFSRVKNGTPREVVNAIEAHRFAIKNVLSFEPEFEKTQRQLYRSLAEAALGDGDSFARQVAHDSVWWFQQHNPVRYLRGLAFDAKLGFFNVGQFFIQTSTMASAVALSPRLGLKGFATLPLHAYLLAKEAGKEQVLDVLAKRGIGKLSGFASEQEFKDYARFLHQSGFLDMNGSHVMIGEYGPNAHFGTFGEKQNRFREKGRMFFYSAEIWNRLVASRIAYGEAIESGLKLGDERFISHFLKKADDYSFNMTHESAAYWQKGILSIPTQFWSYNMRMMDAMLGSRFTRAQKLRLIATNLFLAGTAGTPVTEGIAEYIKNSTGQTPAINSLMGGIDRGFMDELAYHVTGADVRIGEKYGTGTWLRETYNTLTGNSSFGDKSFAEVLGGASFGILANVSKELYDVGRYAVAESGADMEGHSLTGEAVAKFADEISTLSNANKAMMVAQYQIMKSKGGTIYNDIPSSSAFFVALGFRPEQVDIMSHRMEWQKNRKDIVQEDAQQLIKWRQEAFFNPDKYEENMKKANMFTKLIPPDLRKEVLRQAAKAKENESLYDHVEKKFNQEVEQQNNTETGIE